MVRRMFAIFIFTAILATLQIPAQAASVRDPDDPLPRLDIRSASAVQVSEHRLRLKLVFWDRTPQWLLRRRAARIEMSDQAPKRAQQVFGFRFWPNSAGDLRITWGEPGSACCYHARARHPDLFTYAAIIPVSMDGWLVKSFRAARTTRLPPCEKPRCGLVGAHVVDKTRWVRT